MADLRTLTASGELVLTDEDEVVNPLDSNLRVYLPEIGGADGVPVGRRILCKTTGLGSLEILSFGGKRVTLLEPQSSCNVQASSRGWILNSVADDITELDAVALRTLWLDAAKGMALPSTRGVSVERVNDTTYRFWRPVGGRVWMEGQLTTGGVANGPYSWNQTYLREILSYVLSPASADVVYGGAWTGLTSQNPAAYLSGRAQQADTVGRTVTITFNFGGGDLYLIYTGRTNGNYVEAVLNGSGENCNALPSNGTYRYIDTYTAVDLTHKQRVCIARGLASGDHELVLTLKADKNPSGVANDRFIFNAIGLTGPSDGFPFQANTRPLKWTALTAYAQFDQIQVNGKNYSCTTAGTTGATAPSHSSGSAADGTVTWLFMAASSYATREHRLQAAGSQLEYAYEFAPDGEDREDVGGVIHGNETLDSLEWSSEGYPVATPAVGDWIISTTGSIALRQNIEVTHSGTGATVVNETTLVHSIHREKVSIHYEHAWQVDGTLGFYYSHMWPILAYSVASEGDFRWGFDQIATPQGGVRLRADYNDDDTGPIIGRTQDYIMAAWGDVLMPAGAAGVPSSESGPLTAIAMLAVSPDGVGRYLRAGSLFAGMAMNTSGADAPGFSSHSLKMYFERANAAAAVAVATGDVWRAAADYYLFLAPGSTLPFPPR